MDVVPSNIQVLTIKPKHAFVVPILTARLELRPFRETDIHSIAQLLADPEATKYIGDVRSGEVAAEFVRIMRDAFAARGWGTLAVVSRGTDDCHGYCGVRPLAHTPEVEIAFALKTGVLESRICDRGCSGLDGCGIHYARNRINCSYCVSRKQSKFTCVDEVRHDPGVRSLRTLANEHSAPFQDQERPMA